MIASSRLAACLAILCLLAARCGAQDSFRPIAGWDQQLFPSYLVATATIRLPEDLQVDDESDDSDVVVLGDRQGVLGVELESPGDEVDVEVAVLGSAILEPSTLSATLDEEGTTYRLFPRIRYRYDVLGRNKQSIPVSVTFRVIVGDEEPEEHTATLTLRSINDCPYSVAQADEEPTDISFMFAAYVNEQHPLLDKILREALDQGVVDSFTGYQSGDRAEVYRQAYALWNALSQRDVRYSNITTSSAANALVSSQHVRLLDESIHNGQANCVDGSVLLAALLRKIDIEPVLVYVPGHCYLAFYLDAGMTELVGLETTLVGGSGDDDLRALPDGTAAVDEAWQATDSWATFCAAVAMGNDDLAENEDRFDLDDPDYQRVSIAGARQLGILPIAGEKTGKYIAPAAE